MQTITITSTHVNPEQVVGVIVAGVDTHYTDGSINYCALGNSVGNACSDLEARITTKVEISFDPANCGTDSGNTDTNWCTRAMVDAGHAGLTQDTTLCDSSTCSTSVPNAALTLGDSSTGASAIQTAICNMSTMSIGGSSIYFFTDDGTSSGACVVTVSAISTYVDAATYFYAYHIKMSATNSSSDGSSYILGQIPALQVKFTSLSHDANIAVPLATHGAALTIPPGSSIATMEHQHGAFGLY